MNTGTRSWVHHRCEVIKQSIAVVSASSATSPPSVTILLISSQNNRALIVTQDSLCGRTSYRQLVEQEAASVLLGHSMPITTHMCQCCQSMGGTPNAVAEQVLGIIKTEQFKTLLHTLMPLQKGIPFHYRVQNTRP